MPMPNVILIGGFLGAGKTTLVAETVRRLTSLRYRVGVVTNDQATDLVDSQLLTAQGLAVSEVAGGCFCCSFDDFTARLGELNKDIHADMLIGEPVGSCADLASTVVRPLQQLYASEYQTLPYSVLVDAYRWQQSKSAEAWPFSRHVRYIFRLQIEEADAIILSKCDLLTSEERKRTLHELSQTYPDRPIFAVSALANQGIEPWLTYVLSAASSGARHIHVDYNDYAAGEAVLGWLNLSANLLAETPRDWCSDCAMILDQFRSACASEHHEIAHAKLLLWAGDQLIAGSLLATTAPGNLRGSIQSDVRWAHLILNIRVEAPAEAIRQMAKSMLERLANSGLRVEVANLASFHPARPSPTHQR